MIRPISAARFEALCFMRRPTAKLYAEEKEWYADQSENVLGIVSLTGKTMTGATSFLDAMN
jgi:hypothetical protein